LDSKLSKPASIRVAMVDEDANIRRQLTELIQSSNDLKLVGIFEHAEAAIAGIPPARPDVVVMDIHLADGDGVDCVRTLKSRFPAINFLILTHCEDSERLVESFKAGASGYMLKRTSPARLLDAIREVHEGGSPMTPQIARLMVKLFSDTQPLPSDVPQDPVSQLSPGEAKALHQLAQGYPYKVIADHLGISVHGVRNYVRRIYEKLQVHSRTEAVVKYLRH